MADEPGVSESPSRRRHARRQYIIKPRLQLAVTFHLVAVLVVIGVLYALALFVLPDKDALERLNAADTRRVFILANVAYFVLASAILWTVAILLTHRIAGPVFILERSLRQMREGDVGAKIFVRKRDYLKGLVSEVEKLSAELKEQRDKRSEIVASLQRCLEESDLESAREWVTRLGAADVPAPEEAPATVGSAGC